MKFIHLLESLLTESSRFKTLYDANVEAPGQKDYYTLIGLKKGVSQESINSKIESIKQKIETSPDSDNPKFDEIKKALDILGNEQKRKKYDASYGKKIPFEVFKEMIFADPDTKAPQGFDKENATPEDMEKVKVGAYTQWMLKNYQEPKLDLPDYMMDNPREVQASIKEYRRLFIEDIEKLSVDLLKFHRFKNKLENRDINKYTPDTLSRAVEDFKLSKDQKSSKEEKMMKENPFKFPGSIIDYVGPNWTVVRIDNSDEADKFAEAKAAACHFGGFYDTRDEFDETNWCTSKVDGSYFNQYIKKGSLYVILPNKSDVFGKKTGLPKERYQLHFDPSYPQYMDRRDRPVSLYELFKDGGKLSELREYFKPEIAKNVSTPKGTKVHIEFPKGPAGLFASLYGADDLLNNLSTDTTNLILENTDKNNPVKLTIPKSIGNLTKLRSILWDGVVSEVPDEICNCKSLQIMALPNNPDMKKLPECVKNMDKLSFINLMGSGPDNGKTKLPDSLQDIAVERQMAGLWYIG
jgi:curved DNA-binding protein CbpA